MNDRLPGVDLAKVAASLRTAGDALRDAADAISKPRADAEGNGSAPLRTDLLTGRQLGAIHGMARRAGLSRDQLAELVHQLTGKRVTDLSRSEASDVIDRLNEPRH